MLGLGITTSGFRAVSTPAGSTALSPTTWDAADDTPTTGGRSLGALTPTGGTSPYTYAINGGDDAAKFSIGGAGSDELILDDGMLDIGSQSEYTCVVRVTDDNSQTHDETMTVTVVAETLGSELAVNGDFSDSSPPGTGWTLIDGALDAVMQITGGILTEGPNLKNPMYATADQDGFGQPESGKSYRITFSVANRNLTWRLEQPPDTLKFAINADGAWSQRIDVDTTGYIRVRVNSSSGAIDIDDFSLKEITNPWPEAT